jgi:hypothetical protein
MAIEFPLSPSIDDQFTAYGKTWYWDGEKWIFASTNPETISAVSPITYETVTQTIELNQSLISIEPTQVTGTAVVDNDLRLTDSRTPVSHSASHESGGSDEIELSPSQITGTAVIADDVHLISFVTSSTRPETPSEGQVIYESDTSLYFGWDGSEWASIGSGNEIYIVTYEYTATTNQTIFTGSDDNSLSMSFTDDLIQVFLNGVLLNPNDDYTTSEDTVTLTSGAASGDSLTVVAFASFNVANTYTIAEADAAIASATAGLGGATGGGTDQVFYENDVAVTTSYTISTDKNAISGGPVEIDSGATVTIPSGSVWSVV